MSGFVGVLVVAACSGGSSMPPPDAEGSATETSSGDGSTSGGGTTTSSSSSDEGTSSSDEGTSSSTGEPTPEPGCDNGLVPGDFCFMQVSDYGPFEGAWSVGTADFDGDDLPDLAVSASEENTVHVLFGDGAGRFGNAVVLPTGARPLELVTGDLNLDDDWDLAICNGDSANLSVIYGLDGPSFDPDVTFAVGDNPRPLVSGDLDGNGYPDLVVAREGGPVALRLLMGSATGLQVSTGPLVDDMLEVLALEVADINGDGSVDLLATVGGLDEIVLLAGDGQGGFEEAARISASGEDPYVLAAADIDGDGDLDVLVGNRELDSGEPSMRVFDNAGDGTLEERGNYPQPGIGDIATGDLDADGDIDVVLSTLQGQSLVTLRNDGTGLLDEQDTFDLGAGSEPRGVLVADLDADGAADFATADTTGWRLVVFLSHP